MTPVCEDGVSVNSETKYTNMGVLQETVHSQTNRLKLAPFSKAEVNRADQGGPCKWRVRVELWDGGGPGAWSGALAKRCPTTLIVLLTLNRAAD